MKLVVGYLATPGGADAVALGVRLARTVGADLELRLVVEADDVTTRRLIPDSFHDAVAEQGSAWLDGALQLVPDDVTASAEVIVAESVTEALSAEAVRLDAAAIVVGGSGGGLIGRYWLGSDVDDLLHFAPVPVAVAPRGTRHSDVTRVRTVTCAIGSRAGAKQLLDTAVRLSTGAPLRLVSLVTVDRHGDAGIEKAREKAGAALESALAALPAGAVVTTEIVEGATVEEAVEKLPWRDGDVLVLGSSRLAPPRRLFIGSTAARILRVLDVPIIVTPGEGE